MPGYWDSFNALANRVIPEISLRTLGLIGGVALTLVLLYGVTLGGPLAFLSLIFLVFLIVPSAVIFRLLDKRSLVEVEEIVIKSGVAVHRQFSIKIDRPGTYKAAGSNRTFTPGDLFRDSLKRRKYPYYFLYGYRARAVVVYSGDSETPVAYSPPAIPGEILYTASTTTILKKGLAKIFEGRQNLTVLILIVLVVIAILLGASWLQAGGGLPQLGGA